MCSALAPNDHRPNSSRWRDKKCQCLQYRRHLSVSFFKKFNNQFWLSTTFSVQFEPSGREHFSSLRGVSMSVARRMVQWRVWLSQKHFTRFELVSHLITPPLLTAFPFTVLVLLTWGTNIRNKSTSTVFLTITRISSREIVEVRFEFHLNQLNLLLTLMVVGGYGGSCDHCLSSTDPLKGHSWTSEQNWRPWGSNEWKLFFHVQVSEKDFIREAAAAWNKLTNDRWRRVEPDSCHQSR